LAERVEESPLQIVAGVASGVATTRAGCVTVATAVLKQPAESVTVNVYMPAKSPVAESVVCPAGSLHLYVYGITPPVAVPAAVPLLPPLQVTVVVDVMLAVSPGILGTVTLIVAVHLLASATPKV